MEQENVYKLFYEAIIKATDEPTEDYCGRCTCRVPCGNDEREILRRIWKIIDDFQAQTGL